jgi:4-hydroxybutyrate CoA-transferase
VGPEVTGPIAERIVTADAAVKAVRSGMRVRFPTGHNPQLIGDALAARVGHIDHVQIDHCAAVGDFAWFGQGLEETFSVTHEHWAGPACWPAMKERRHDYLPMPFSLRFKAASEGRPVEERRSIDVVCLQVSPPDDGMVNLGGFVWDAPAYMERADIVLAEILPSMPIMTGDSSVPASLVTQFVESEPADDIILPASGPTDSRTQALAANVAKLIGDGDCIQVGAGTATFGVAAALSELLCDRNDLGWHSETTPPTIPTLISAGVINSSQIPTHPGVSVSAGWVITADSRPFMERNPKVQAWQINRVVDPRAVAEIPRFKAVNTVIMMDLSGQAAAETVGSEMHGGTGGLLELTMGALWSRGGRAITVLPATDRTGLRSRIVPVLPEGTQGTVPRTLVDTVVTEFGVARLWGRTVRERAELLTEIAAPQFREELRHASRTLFYP